MQAQPHQERLLPGHHPWKVTLLRAGGFRLDGGGMFGLIPKTIWSTWAPADELNRIELNCNCLVLDDGSQRVLVETGFGSKWSAKDRGIYSLENRTVIDALAEHDLRPKDITHVIVTHLHFDHAAGLTQGTDAAPTLSFPNATIIVQQREWEDALANRSTMTRTYLRSHLDPIRDRIRPVDGPTEVLPGIAVRPLAGHTWGQQGVFIRTPDNVTVFPADLIPTANHIHLAANMGYDILPYENMLNKRDLLAEAADQGWTLVLDHDPRTPIVRVVRDPDDHSRFRFQAVKST
jgi:glyoxylase-like metal-dependent hydrolase (beta-lactamase superfamily II)